MQYTNNTPKLQVVKEEDPPVYGKQIPLIPKEDLLLSQYDKILSCTDLTHRESKLLYLISKLTANQDKACTAFNAYLGKKTGIPYEQVTKVLTALDRNKYIDRIEYRDEQSKEVVARDIKLTKKTTNIFMSDPPSKNDVPPPSKNNQGTLSKERRRDKSAEYGKRRNPSPSQHGKMV